MRNYKNQSHIHYHKRNTKEKETKEWLVKPDRAQAASPEETRRVIGGWLLVPNYFVKTKRWSNLSYAVTDT